MLYSLLKTTSKKTLRLCLTAWVLFFIYGQTQAASHFHVDIDSHAEEICDLCFHSQDYPTTDNKTFTSIALGISSHLCATHQASWVRNTYLSSYLSRAPPQS